MQQEDAMDWEDLDEAASERRKRPEDTLLRVLLVAVMCSITVMAAWALGWRFP